MPWSTPVADRRRREAWQPVEYSETGAPGTYSVHDMRAIQALAQGTAGEHEQRRALDWIIHHAAMTYEETFQPGNPDATAYVQGRRSVGLAIVKLMKLRPEAMKGN